MPGILIVGAIVQPRFPRAGRVLMCAGALSLSLWVVSFCLFILPESRFANRPTAIALALVAVLLVAWCDVAIVVEELKLRRDQGEQHAEIVPVSNWMRWLAGVTGAVTAVAFAMAQGLGLLSGFLIVGALVAKRFPRSGRDLMWFGATVVSLFALPLGGGLLFSTRTGTDPRVIVGGAVSFLLVLWCDVALIREAFKTRRARRPRTAR